MQIHQIKDQAFEANAYLIECSIPILIDTGTGWDISRTLETIGRIVDPKRIETIILTHRHLDHVGGAEELSRIFGSVLYASVDDSPPLIQVDQVSTGARLFGKSFHPLPVRVLNYGAVINLGDGELDIIHTPGHTIGSISLLERNTKSLFSGDTIFANGSVGRWDFVTGDYYQLVQSIQKLRVLDVENLYPGHGPFVEGEGRDHIEMGLDFLENSGYL